MIKGATTSAATVSRALYSELSALRRQARALVESQAPRAEFVAVMLGINRVRALIEWPERVADRVNNASRAP